jgi:hypothetical protein
MRKRAKLSPLFSSFLLYYLCNLIMELCNIFLLSFTKPTNEALMSYLFEHESHNDNEES